MQLLINVIESHQDWLMERILLYAQEHSFTKYTLAPGEGLKGSVAGLTDSLLKAIRRFDPDLPELVPEEDLANDPMNSFAVEEAGRHRERGVPLPMFLGLMKYYKQAYLDLLDWKFRQDAKIEKYRLFVERSFDRFEIAFCDEWVRKYPAELIENLQGAIRGLNAERDALRGALAQREKALAEQGGLLEQKDIAMTEVIGRIDAEKERIESQIRANLDQILFPLLQKLKDSDTKIDNRHLDLIEVSLKSLGSSFGQEITRRAFSLTKREIEICNLIKNGLSSKQVAQMLHLSIRSVENHRKNIRRKLDLTNRHANLASYLSSL
jgi:DNA-binding CsgD family transcriptional regulator